MKKPYWSEHFFTGLAVAALLGAGACHPAYRATATNTQVQKTLCGEEWLTFPDQPHPMFEELTGPVQSSVTEVALPLKYTRYKIDADTLKAFFAQLKSGKNGGIVIPVAKHCEPFSVKRSGAMAPELQLRYPDLISLQGTGVNNKAADVRLDWDGRQMRGQLTFNGAIYFIMPVQENSATTYLFYNREDTGETKQPFEQPLSRPATNTRKILYDR